jgi:Mn2+/Fe2+ NRAMP family transporter
MIADNDAGGITTYAATWVKYRYHLIWLMVVLIPVCYYVQEMTVRLGAVTKRATLKQSLRTSARSGAGFR